MIEIRDARLPQTATHPLFPLWRRLFQCPYLVIYTHEDLITQEQIQMIRQWTSRSMRIPETQVRFEDCRGYREAHGLGKDSLLVQLITTLCMDGSRAKSQEGPTRRALVVGIPNVGKSSFIYKLTKHLTARKRKKGLYHAPVVRDFSGETQTITSHWLCEDPRIVLIDTPGLFPPAWQLERDIESVYKLAACGGLNVSDLWSSRSDGLDVKELIAFLLFKLNQSDSSLYVSTLGLSGPTSDVDTILAHLHPRGSTDRAQLKAKALTFVSAFNQGRLGKVVLDDVFLVGDKDTGMFTSPIAEELPIVPSSIRYDPVVPPVEVRDGGGRR